MKWATGMANTRRNPASAGLERLFRPESIAIVGASDSNPWTGLVAASLKSLGFHGKLHLINRRGSRALGQSTFTSCAAIGEAVDAAFIIVPAGGVGDALDDMAGAGIRHGVLVTSGFAEIGEEGAAAQEAVFAHARKLGITLLGPNSVGYANFVDSIGLGAFPLQLPALVGNVAIVSQSGAVAGQMVRFAQQQQIGLSYAVSLGNEAMLGLEDVLHFLIEDEHTKAICLFAETIRSSRAFVECAARALSARKPIILLKVGRGSLAAEVAKGHTGALVGNDTVLDAACREMGVIRVSTIELMLQTAHLVSQVGVLENKGFAIASISGGACEITADLGEEAGIRFTRLGPDTCARIRPLLPAFGHVNNPLDVTGEALRDPTVFEKALQAMGDDPDVGLVACIFDLPNSDKDGSRITETLLANIARGLQGAAVPAVLIEQCFSSRSERGGKLLGELGGLVTIGGIDYAMQAISLAYQWSSRARSGWVHKQSTLVVRSDARPVSERETLDYLAEAGVPVIPAVLARSREEAIAAARGHCSVALKILSPDIAHKTEVGGILLGLEGDDAVGHGYEMILKRVGAAAPGARIEGVTVSPMRDKGTELIVGVARDADWGLAITVGLGGIWVELIGDSSLRLLPVTPAQVVEMLDETKAGRLLRGWRGGPAADINAVAQAISAIGDAAMRLGPDLMSLEINPFHVGDTIECLDGLAVWKSG